MTEEIKKQIDAMTLEQLLRKWRFSPTGSPFFKGEAGKYYNKILREKKEANNEEFVATSKRIGW